MPILPSSELRVPPQNLEAEQALLATCLLRTNAVPLALSRVERDDFYRESHQLIFSAISSISQAGGTADTVTVMEALNKSNELDCAGGAVYLAQLSSNIPSLAKVEEYCAIVREKAILREMIALAADISTQCYELTDTGLVTDMFGKRFFELAAGKSEDATFLSAVLPRVADNIKTRCESDTGLAGVSTGFIELDRWISGLVPTDLIILAARPAMGKTAFAMNIAENVARQGVPVLVFSLEMGKEQLTERLVSRNSGVISRALRKGLLNDSTWPKVNEALGSLASVPVIIDDTPALSITQIRARAKMQHVKHKIGLVVVDYLQLARGQGGNREQEIADISRGLKALAKELGIPVLALSQLNRSLESRTDKRPLMSDLRESGAIEQDADTIAFIYRDEVYNKAADNPLKGVAEIIIGKQRSGSTGIFEMWFEGEYTQFKDKAI